MKNQSKTKRTLVPVRNNAKGKAKRYPKESDKGDMFLYIKGQSKFHN